MVYTELTPALGNPSANRIAGESGYMIYAPAPYIDHPAVMAEDLHYAIYTDDGCGNGDFLCFAVDAYWANRIAAALDAMVTR